MKHFESCLMTRQTYEAPTAEIIEIETQSVLCSSGGETPATSNFNGDGGIQFGTDGGTW